MKVPKYRQHSTRDLGFVEWKGKRKYFTGRYNSQQSRAEYREFLQVNCGVSAPKPTIPSAAGMSIANMCGTYLAVMYEQENGQKRGIWGVYHYALKPFVNEYGAELASNFGPLMLKRWQAKLADKQLSRAYIGVCVSCIKQTFRWAASEELVAPSVWHGLQAVQSLRRGKSKAKEQIKREPVPWAWVELTLPFLSQNVRDMILLQWLTGVRSMSLCHAKPAQFKQDGEFLLWRPRHKTESSGNVVVLPLGPRAQSLLAPYLTKDNDRYLFSPQTTNCNRRYGERYTTLNYMNCLRKGVTRLNKMLAKENCPPLPLWSPHRLRHAKGHAVRAQFGLEACQAVLGHAGIATSEIYSQKRLDLAKQVARLTG